MLRYVTKRLLLMIPTVFVVSLITFYIIQLPPGDFMTTYIAEAEAAGERLDLQAIRMMRENYGLDRPWYVQYGKWIGGIVTRGDFGFSFKYNRPVMTIIRQRMAITIFISLVSLLFTYMIAIPVGIFSATHQYTWGDYLTTLLGFLGMATPNFLLGIILMYLSFRWFGNPMLGLQSPEYIGLPLSIPVIVDFVKHLIIPVIVIGTAGASSLIRVMRGQLLDELRQPYVETALAKGLSWRRLLFKYPVRAAINPILSTLGWTLTAIFSGSTITAIVLNLPTQGPVMYEALLSQDMYLAGSWLLILTVLTVIGTLVSDILLAWLDPRIREEYS